MRGTGSEGRQLVGEISPCGCRVTGVGLVRSWYVQARMVQRQDVLGMPGGSNGCEARQPSLLGGEEGI